VVALLRMGFCSRLYDERLSEQWDNRATISPQRRDDREDKELLPYSILGIIRPREVYKV
jgi:hypothetical protein